MFIGGSAASTAGGIKVQTFALLFFAIVAAVRGLDQVEAFRRRVPMAQVLRALSIALLSIAVVFVVALALNVAERFVFHRVLFEAISALATVGYSTGITPETTPAGRVLLIVSMFIGRLGPLTLVLALAARTRRTTLRLGRRVDQDRIGTGRAMRAKRRRQVAVLGLGRFGSAVARELTRLGHEVLAVDADAKAVQDLADEVTYAAQADITDSDALKGLGLSAFDTAIVGGLQRPEGEHPRHGARAAPRRQAHRRQGRRRGARIDPQRRGGEPSRVPRARDRVPDRAQLRRAGVTDYLDAAPGYGVARIAVTGSWVGKRLGELDLQKTCGVTAVLLSRDEDVVTELSPSYVLRAGDTLIVHGPDEDLERVPEATTSQDPEE